MGRLPRRREVVGRLTDVPRNRPRRAFALGRYIAGRVLTTFAGFGDLAALVADLHSSRCAACIESAEAFERRDGFPGGSIRLFVLDDGLVLVRNRRPGRVEAYLHEDVTLARVVQTCGGCPSSWDAWTTGGRYLYLRYRSNASSWALLASG